MKMMSKGQVERFYRGDAMGQANFMASLSQIAVQLMGVHNILVLKIVLATQPSKLAPPKIRILLNPTSFILAQVITHK